MSQIPYSQKAVNRRVEVDRGFAWVALASSFVNYFVSIGVAFYACGVYLVAMIDGYRIEKAQIYIAGALCSGLHFFSGPLASFLVDKAGLRVVAVGGSVVASLGLLLSANAPSLYYHYVTFAITGVGCGLMFHTSIVISVVYFDKYRVLAAAVLSAAGGVTMMVFPNLVRKIIEIYTWRPSFYIISSICLNTCVFSMLIRLSPQRKESDKQIRQALFKHPRNEDLGNVTILKTVEAASYLDATMKVHAENSENVTKNENENGSCPSIMECGDSISDGDKSSLNQATEKIGSDSGLLHNRLFWLLVPHYFLVQGGLQTFIILMPDLYAVGGIEEWQISVLFVLWGAGNIIGRLVVGPLLLKIVSPLVAYCVSNLIIASSVLLYIYNTNFVCLVIANVVTSISVGSFVTCIGLSTAYIFGVDLVNRGIGYRGQIGGIGIVVCPPLLSKLYDTTLRYTWTVVVVATMLWLSLAVIIMVARIRRRQV